MGMLPPLVLELRAKAGEFYAEMGAAKKEVASMGGAAEGGATRVQKAGKVGKAAFLGIAAGAAIVGVESLKSAIAYQKSTTLLQTAGGETAANMKMVSAGILQVSNDTGISAENMSEGMYIVEKSGNRGAAGLTVLRAAAEGATAEGVGVNTMATALTSVMASFNIPATDAAKAMSALDRGAGLAKTTMQDFASSLSSVTPAANAAHMKLPGVLANIATLTQHGTSAAEATQELAHTIMKLSGTPTAPMQNAMNGLGISSQQLRDAMAGPQGLTGAIGIVQDAIRSHLGPAGAVVVNTFKQSAQASANMKVELSHMSGELLANSQALANGTMNLSTYTKTSNAMPLQQKQMALGFAATAKQAAGFNTLLTKGNQVTRTAAGALKDVMGDSVSFKTALMLTGVATDKSSSSLAYNTKAMKDIQDQYNKGGAHIATYAETQGTLSVQLAKAKAAVENLGIKIGTALIPVVSKMLGWITKGTGWLMDHKAVLIGLGVVIGGALVVAFLAWAVAAATAAAATVAATWPVLAIIAAIALLVAGIIYVWNHWKQIWTWIKDLAAKVWGWLGDMAKKLWSGLVDAFKHVLSFFASIGSWIWEKLVTLADTITGFGGKVIGWIAKGIDDGAAAIATWFKNLGTWIWGKITGLLSTITGFGSKVIGWIGDGIVSGADAIGTWFRNLGTWIWQKISGLASAIAGFGGKVIGWIFDGIKTGFKAILWWYEHLAIWIWDGIKGLAGLITTYGGKLIGWIKDGIVNGATAIWTWFKGLPAFLWSKISSAYEAYTDWGVAIINKIKAGIANTAHAIWDWIKGLPALIWAQIVDVWNGFVDWGSKIIDNIVTGITNAAYKIGDAVKAAASDLNPFADQNHTLTSPGAPTGTVYYPGNALGGDIPKGWSWVGEDGPELVHSTGARQTVFSNPSTPGGKSLPGVGGGSTTHHNTTTQHISVTAVTNASPAYIAGAIGWKLRQM